MTRLLPPAILLVLVTGAFAQLNHPDNEVGVYTVANPIGCETAQVTVAPYTPFAAYVVLTNPYNEQLGRPVTTVGSFEFRLEIPPSVFVLHVQYPPGCVWMPPPPPDYLSGCPVPVTDGVAVLLAFQFMPTMVETGFFHLAPLQTVQPAIPGAIVFTDKDDEYSLQVMHPVSGSFDVPVFAVNWDGEMSFCETVPARPASFGAVKALYR